jgi:hypothetical protein
MVWRVEMAFVEDNGRQDVVVNISSSRLAGEVQEHIRTGKTIYHGSDEKIPESVRIDWSKAVSIHVIESHAPITRQ